MNYFLEEEKFFVVVFITQSYFKASKDVRLNTTHFLS